MKLKKYLALIASFFLLTGCSIVFGGGSRGEANNQSNPDGPDHVHTFDNYEYEFDEEYHWHPSTCGHDVVDGKEKHTFDDGFIRTDDDEVIEIRCVVCYKFIQIPSYGVIYNLSDDGTHYIASAVSSDYQGDIIVRDSVFGISVTEIGEMSFYGCVNCRSISIPDSITVIGQQAFEDFPTEKMNYYNGGYYIGNEVHPYHALICVEKTCKDFVLHEDTLLIAPAAFSRGYPETETIVLNDKVIFLGNGAFSCAYLTSITMPDTITEIPFACFHYCIHLTQLTLPSHITSIGDRAFYDCWTLEEISIPSTVTSIGEEAFQGCKALKQLYIPDGVTSIGDRFVINCESLERISVGGNNNYYYSLDGILYDYTLTKIIAVPATKSSVNFTSNIVEICPCAFYACKNITSITLPNTIKTIGNYAFYSCTGITAISMPNNLTIIEAYAFATCSNLATLNLNRALKSIGNCAFQNDYSLTEIKYNGNKSDYHKISLGGNCYQNVSTVEVVCDDGTTTLFH